MTDDFSPRGLGLGRAFEKGRYLSSGASISSPRNLGFDPGNLFQGLGDSLLQHLEAKLHRLGRPGRCIDQAFAAHARLGAGQHGDLETLVRIVTHDFAKARQLAVDYFQGDVRDNVVRPGSGATESQNKRAFFLIAQSFLDFFKEKQHTIVPSSSLLPDAPNLLFTNAGMNQFVPIFLDQAPCPYSPPRAADTQKCIRAGGKHNDLEDVGFDTYHHTFFEMLGNWSFGNYFKKEAIEWAWELVVGRWGFPPSRVYATIYSPGPGDPASLDREAHEHWSEIFIQAKLDPAYHVVHGNKKDNFWMMGDTGPCGPCSELHIDLTPGPRDLDIPRQIAGRNLVNKGDARCIEIWNLVFIQFNANPDGTFADLPAKHVDTGMGFERVVSMIQGTKGLTDFSPACTEKISNYNTDIFGPLFAEIEKLTGKTYTSTLPAARDGLTEQEKVDVAFRVIADHVRTLSFSIADGIQPSNEGRGYVLRRILRRAVKYGRNLGLKEPFLGKLVDVLGKTMGHIFPEVVAKADLIKKTLTNEEESFFRTLERGIELFRVLQSLTLL